MLSADTRYQRYIGGANLAQLGNVADVARAHFRDKYIVIFQIRVIYRKRDTHGRIMRTRSRKNPVFL